MPQIVALEEPPTCNWTANNLALTWELLCVLIQTPGARAVLWPRPRDPCVEMTEVHASEEVAKAIFNNRNPYMNYIDENLGYYGLAVKSAILVLKKRYDTIRGEVEAANERAFFDKNSSTKAREFRESIIVDYPYYTFLIQLNGDNEPSSPSSTESGVEVPSVDSSTPDWSLNSSREAFITMSVEVENTALDSISKNFGPGVKEKNSDLEEGHFDLELPNSIETTIEEDEVLDSPSFTAPASSNSRTSILKKLKRTNRGEGNGEDDIGLTRRLVKWLRFKAT